MEITNENDLLHVQLQTLYSMEDQLVKAIPGLIRLAKNSDLKRALENHLEVTEKQRDRLEKICRERELDLTGIPDQAMTHLLKSVQTVIQQVTNPELIDTVIMDGCDKVEHYEMAAYISAMTLAERLEDDDLADTLNESFDEEQQAADMIESLAQE